MYPALYPSFDLSRRSVLCPSCVEQGFPEMACLGFTCLLNSAVCLPKDSKSPNLLHLPTTIVATLHEEIPGTACLGTLLDLEDWESTPRGLHICLLATSKTVP